MNGSLVQHEFKKIMKQADKLRDQDRAIAIAASSVTQATQEQNNLNISKQNQ